MSFLKSFQKFLNKHWVQCILLFILFIFLASLFLNLPLLDIHKNLINHVDAYLVSWVWSWEWHALTTDPLNFFNANIYAPFTNTLAFTETMLGTAILAWPILLVFNNNIVLAYNVVMLLTYAISGLGMYLLVYYLTKNKWAAIVAGLIYALAPFKLIHNGHLHLSGMWLPFVFLYLYKFFKQQTWKNILLLILFIYLVFLTGFHYFIFLPIVILVFLIVFLSTKQFKFNQDNIKKILIALIILVLVVLPIILPYFAVREDYNQSRRIAVIEAYSPDVIDYFISPFLYNNFYVNFSHIEMAVSPGIVIALLFIFSIYIIGKDKKNLSILDKKINVYGLGFISLIALLISFGFYIQLTPYDQTGVPGLYALFYHCVPGFSGVRAIGRYSIFILLSISIMVGYGIHIWHKKIKDIFKKVLLLFLIITFFFMELAFVPSVGYSPIEKKPDQDNLYQWMKNQPKHQIFLELPMGNNYKKSIDRTINNDIAYVFFSREHFRKLVNGYSGYYSPGYLKLAEELKSFKPDEHIQLIKEFQTNYLVFHFDHYEDPEEVKTKILGDISLSQNFEFVTNFGNNYIYQVIYD